MFADRRRRHPTDLGKFATGVGSTVHQHREDLGSGLICEHCADSGELGAGHVTKLINNFMGMTTACTMSQAFAVAERSGVNKQQLFDIMSAGPSNSPFMQFCKNYAVDGVSDLGFSINNANKDLGYFLKLAEDVGTRAEIAEGTANNLQAAADAGMGDGNVPEIFDYFAKL